MCAEAADGQSLVAYSESLGLRWADVAAWISGDPERERALSIARAAALDWITDKVMRELKAISLVDMGQAFESDGSLRRIEDMPFEIRASLAGIDVKELYHPDGSREGRVVKAKFQDKVRALELLGKQHGMFRDVKVLEAGDSLTDLVMAAHANGGRIVEAEARVIEG